MLEVLATGPLATVQDLGRAGYQGLGVARSGALDRAALGRANLLVGNDPAAAGLELSLGRFRARFHAGATIALTGAPAPVTIDGRPADFDAPQTIQAGEELRVGAPTRGLHVYLAVAGGIDVAPVLGSRSTDTLSGIGPPPLRRGTHLPVGSSHGEVSPPLCRGTHLPGSSHGEVSPPLCRGTDLPVGSSHASGEPASPLRRGTPLPAGASGGPAGNAPPAEGTAAVRIRFGPRDAWFSDPLALTRNPYRLTTSNRIGARLEGPPLARARGGELPSEGLIPGAIQVPGDGRPIVFLADHPATGGYPVIAVVHPDDLAFVAQARPGASVVFRGP